MSDSRKSKYHSLSTDCRNSDADYVRFQGHIVTYNDVKTVQRILHPLILIYCRYLILNGT